MDFNSKLEASYRANYKKWKKQLTGGSITPEMAEDIIQHACVNALSAKDTYDESRDFDSWLGTIITNSRGDILNQERNGGMTGRST
ncbi:putative RNA polymerase sigma-70 region 2 [Vibrio virus VPMCC5]|uniref:sigma factor n=1 Tax=Salmonella enterica TaxID=28901 RepID=UPI0030E171C5|nr:putative RNA polymerase sigma-70 region 2 [Vibrio virus VPMCC5]